MPKRNNYTKGLYTIDYKVISMSKETGLMVVGFIDSPKQAGEIQGIVRLTTLAWHIQDLNKEG